MGDVPKGGGIPGGQDHWVSNLPQHLEEVPPAGDYHHAHVRPLFYVSAKQRADPEDRQ